jgi:hypothetical protein
VLEAWDLASDTSLGGILATSGLVAEDPILTLGVFDQTPDDFLWESLTLRVTADGSVPVKIALDPHAVWGDVAFTGLRVGPDGLFYQLRSDIDTGVTIARYPLGTTQTTPPPSSPSPTTTPTAGTSPPTSAGTSPPTATSSPTPSPTAAPSSAPPSSPTAVPSTSAAGGSASAELIAGITLVGLAVAGLGGWWVWRRRTTAATAPSVSPDDSGEPGDAADGDDGA